MPRRLRSLPSDEDGAGTRRNARRPSSVVASFTSLVDLRPAPASPPTTSARSSRSARCDSIAGGWTRPMMLWMVDTASAARPRDRGRLVRPPSARRPGPQGLRPDRRRREEYAALGFVTDTHPMRLHEDDARAASALCPSTELHRHVGGYVLMAGMLTTAKPVHTLKDEPMEFATFDDGHGLIETVLFPRRLPRPRPRPLRSGPVPLPGESGGGIRRGDGDGHPPRPAGSCGGTLAHHAVAGITGFGITGSLPRQGHEGQRTRGEQHTHKVLSFVSFVPSW